MGISKQHPFPRTIVPPQNGNISLTLLSAKEIIARYRDIVKQKKKKSVSMLQREYRNLSLPLNMTEKITIRKKERKTQKSLAFSFFLW
jgi:hypothetical protein